MSEIAADLIDRMMVKCARRCCICRRFRPTKLQVHHIVERGEGGNDDEDNLIVVCFSCHSDVHTKVPFARRFSVDELKGHRDALIKCVESGRLSADDADDTDIVMRRVADRVRSDASREMDLSAEAVEILLAAANATGSREGMVVRSKTNAGLRVFPGNQADVIQGNRRSEAKYRHAISQLLDCGLLEESSEALLEVTYDGYLAADEIAARGSCASIGAMKSSGNIEY